MFKLLDNSYYDFIFQYESIYFLHEPTYWFGREFVRTEVQVSHWTDN